MIRQRPPLSRRRTGCSRSADSLYYLLLTRHGGLVLRWSLSPNNYFFADDWNAAYRGVHALRIGWPCSLSGYNDRPVGALAIGYLQCRGPRPVAFHAIYAGLHLLNVTLAFFIARRSCNRRDSPFARHTIWMLGSACSANLDRVDFRRALLHSHPRCRADRLTAKSTWLTGSSSRRSLRWQFAQRKSRSFSLSAAGNQAIDSLLLSRTPARHGSQYADAVVLGFMAVCICTLSAFPMRRRSYHLSVELARFSRVSFISARFYMRHSWRFLRGILGYAAVSIAMRWRAESAVGRIRSFLLPVLFIPIIAARSTCIFRQHLLDRLSRIRTAVSDLLQIHAIFRADDYAVASLLIL